jgi:hypothetical protein
MEAGHVVSSRKLKSELVSSLRDETMAGDGIVIDLTQDQSR